MKNIIGYTAGVFDLFHIGHLNLLKNAKANCNYLIVGVNSDNLVKQYKNKTPIIPQEERMSILESIKFVDKVVLVNDRDKLLAYNNYKFNRIFVGDDWKDSISYKKAMEQLQPYNIDFVYLPYTKTTSSTLIRSILLNLYNEQE